MDFYKETVEAKSGEIIPVFKSGKSAHSKYNPVRESESFSESAGLFDFAVFIGAAGGYHIEAALKKNPSAKAVVLEKNLSDIDFLKKNIPCIQRLSKNKNVIFECTENIAETLPKVYFPAWHGSIKILTLRSWKEEDKDAYEEAAAKIEGALKKITADFSVQAHFGFLWQKNIFFNLMLLKKIQGKKSGTSAPPLKETVLQKQGMTAAVIAAGPTLDKKISLLKERRKNYFIIATDTAYKILTRNGIIPDAAVSVDAQHLSAQHFCAPVFKDTLYILDLAGNPDIAKKVFECGGRLLFYSSMHPLSSFAAGFFRQGLLTLESGSGTVTIAAADFAKKSGFKNIEIFGADFSYSAGKSYARGSYLDDLYRKNESRIFSAETAWTRLMFRTPLFNSDIKGFLTSDVLKGYKESLEGWILKSGIQAEYTDFTYRLDLNGAFSKSLVDARQNEFDFTGFKSSINQAAEKIKGTDEVIPEAVPLFPALAFYRRKFIQNKISIKELKNLALDRILLYNKRI